MLNFIGVPLGRIFKAGTFKYSHSVRQMCTSDTRELNEKELSG